MKQKPCPICEKPVRQTAFRPFCSKRCADLDLSRWLKGSYAIPGRPSDEADDVPGDADDA
ncbi:MAG: DNA gyrase inhibitor YacG [Henriciella sp.]